MQKKKPRWDLIVIPDNFFTSTLRIKSFSSVINYNFLIFRFSCTITSWKFCSESSGSATFSISTYNSATVATTNILPADEPGKTGYGILPKLSLRVAISAVSVKPTLRSGVSPDLKTFCHRQFHWITLTLCHYSEFNHGGSKEGSSSGGRICQKKEGLDRGFAQRFQKNGNLVFYALFTFVLTTLVVENV